MFSLETEVKQFLHLELQSLFQLQIIWKTYLMSLKGPSNLQEFFVNLSEVVQNKRKAEDKFLLLSRLSPMDILMA